MPLPSYYFAPTSSSTSCGESGSFAGSSSTSSCPCSGDSGGGGDDNYSTPGSTADFASASSAPGSWAGSSSTSSSTTDSCSGNGYSAYPIRYANGETRQISPGLRSGGYGINWGHTLSYSNQLDSEYLGINGYRWFIKELPQLGKDGSGNIAVIGIINDAIWFNKSGSTYVPRFFSVETLVEQGTGANDEFVFTGASGQVIKFYGFDAAIPSLKQGQIKSIADAYGHVSTPTYNASNSVTSLPIGSSPGISYNYDYYTSGSNSGRLQYVTLKNGTTNVRRISYDYYVTGDASGTTGDLKLATLQQWNGSAWDDLGKTLYRYYTSGSSTGFQHGLKYVVGPQAYARLLAAGYTPETVSDTTLNNYADHYFEFNGTGDKKVTKERVNGPGGYDDAGSSSTTSTLEYAYAYSPSGNTDGYNNWKTKTVETLPDGNTLSVYTNYAGQIMLKVFSVGGTPKWYDYFKYDDSGRLIQRAASEAVQSYSEGSAGLVTLNTGTGLIRVYDYYGSSSSTGITALVSSVTLTSPTLRNNFTGWVGFKFQVGSTPLRVNELGRWVVSGNSGTHVVKLVRVDDATDVPNASATVDTSGKTAGQFAYAQLPGTVTLAANTSYYLVSHEVSGGDQWYNYPGCGLSLTGAATLNGPAWSYDSPTQYYTASSQESYVPVSLRYNPDSFAQGRLRYEKVKQGSSGTEIKVRELQYLPQAVGGSTIYPIWRDIQYRSDASGGSTPVETDYDYLWFSSSFQMQERTTIWPAVAADPSGQHGSGVSDRRVERFDEYARLIWIKDERGFLTRIKYDDASGGVIQRIDDVATGQISDSPAVPTGWSTPTGGGLHLITDYTVDNLGRTTEERGPTHSIDISGTSTSIRRVHWTVYKCAAGEVREASGYLAASSYTLIEPITVTKEDYSHRTTDIIVSKRASGVTGALTATEDLSDQTKWVRWTKSLYANNRLGADWTQVYYSIPSSGGGDATNNFNRTVLGFGSMGRHIRTKTPGGTITRLVRDARGWITERWVGTDDTGATETNPAGSGSPNNMVRVEVYQYDGGAAAKNGNLTQVTRYEDASNSRVTGYGYDFRNRRTSMSGEISTHEDYFYDNLDRLIQVDRVDSSSDALIGRAATNFDNRGRVYQRVTYAVNPGTGQVGNSLKDDFWYDPAGNLMLRRSSGNAAFSKATYDGLGRVTKRYVSLNTSTPTYTSAGSVANDTVIRQEEPTYDAASNVIQQTVRERFHDASGAGELQNPGTSPKARVSYTAIYPDVLGREQASANYGTNAASAFSRSATIPARSDTVLVNSTAYNQGGEAYQTTDPQGVLTELTFDKAGRLTDKLEDKGSGKLNRETQYTYSADDRLSTLTAVNAVTGDQVTTYLYGSTLTESNVASNDLLRSVIYPDSSDTDPTGTDQVKFEYNRLGEVKKKTLQKHAADTNATVHEYVYDKLGRQQHDRVTTFGDNIDQTVKRISHTYEVRGMLQKATSYDSATVGSGNVLNEVQIAYNDFSQPITEYQAHGGAVNTGTSPKVQYAYADGSANHIRLTSLTYPDTRATTFDYGTANGNDDLLSRVASLKQSTTVLAGYSYLGVGQIIRVNYSGQPGVELTYIKQGSEGTGDAGDQYTGLDRFGRVVDQRWLKTSDGTHRERILYGFDRASSRTYRDNLVASGGQDEYYTYDALNQLKTLKRGDLNAGKTDITAPAAWEEDFTYDDTGNWHGSTTGYLTKVSGSTTLDQNRSHNKANEVTGITTNSGTAWTVPVQDAVGNITTFPQPASPGSGYDGKYDAWNRLVEVKVTGGSTVGTYRYDGLNRRVTKLTGSTTRHYYYSNRWQVLEERLNTATAADRQFVWGQRHVDDLVLRDRGSERFYVLHDAVSVTAIIDTSGAVQERYGYDAFGYGRVMDANFGARSSSNYDWEVRYGAYRWDSESGLYQVRNRYLHPKLGRWVSRDPVEYEEALNVYVYAINNAITLIDPTGLATTLARCESDKQTALAGDPIIRKLLEALRRHGCRMPTIECDCCEMRTGTSNPGRGGYYTNYSIVLCIETLPPYQAGNPTFAGVLAHELTHALQHCTRGCMPRGCDEAACGEVEAVCTAQQCKGVVPFEQCVARLAAVSLTAFCPKGEGLKAAEAAIARGCCKSKVP